MRFAFIARHRHIWPVAWLCEALAVSRSGFHAGLNRTPSARSRHDEVLVAVFDRSFKSSDRTYGTRRVWHDVLAESLACGLLRVERQMRKNGLRARPRHRGLPKDTGEQTAVSDNLLDRPSRHRRRTRNGLPTSPTSGLPKDGSTWPPLSSCSPVVSSAGR